MEIDKQMFLYPQFDPMNPYQCTVAKQNSPFSTERGLNQPYDYSVLGEQQTSPEVELDFQFFASQDFVDFSSQPTVSNEFQLSRCFLHHSPADQVEQDENNVFHMQALNRDFHVTKTIMKKVKTQAQARKKKSQENKSQPKEENSQNENRNTPGALFGGLLKECKNPSSSFLASQKKFAKSKIEKFLTQVGDYKKNKKTFNSVAIFALRTEDEEVTSLALLIEFLKSDQHFFDFIRQSRMAQKHKEFLYEESSRGLYVKKFELALQYVKDCLKKYKSEGLAVLLDKWEKNYKENLSNKIKEQKTITFNNNNYQLTTYNT